MSTDKVNFKTCSNIPVYKINEKNFFYLLWTYREIWEKIAMFLSNKFDNYYIHPTTIKNTPYNGNKTEQFCVRLLRISPTITTDHLKEAICFVLECKPDAIKDFTLEINS